MKLMRMLTVSAVALAGVGLIACTPRQREEAGQEVGEVDKELETEERELVGGRDKEIGFDKLDADKDGFLSQSEFGAMFTKKDANGDGKITKDELGDTKLDFDKLDADKDGSLSQSELSGAFTSKDANKDGKLSKDELGI